MQVRLADQEIYSAAETFHRSPISQLFRAGYIELSKLKGAAEKGAAADETHAGDIGNVERALRRASTSEITHLESLVPFLATTGSTAPFVGLFGTTFGVINAFAGMASAGAGLASISAGISEALITTGVGIGVAVIGVWCFNYFTNRIDKVGEELASSEADFLDWAEKLVQARADAAGK